MVILLTWGSLESRVQAGGGSGRGGLEHSPTPQNSARRVQKPRFAVVAKVLPGFGRNEINLLDLEAHLGPLAFKVMGLTVSRHPAQLSAIRRRNTFRNTKSRTCGHARWLLASAWAKKTKDVA